MLFYKENIFFGVGDERVGIHQAVLRTWTQCSGPCSVLGVLLTKPVFKTFEAALWPGKVWLDSWIAVGSWKDGRAHWSHGEFPSSPCQLRKCQPLRHFLRAEGAGLVTSWLPFRRRQGSAFQLFLRSQATCLGVSFACVFDPFNTLTNFLHVKNGCRGLYLLGFSCPCSLNTFLCLSIYHPVFLDHITLKCPSIKTVLLGQKRKKKKNICKAKEFSVLSISFAFRSSKFGPQHYTVPWTPCRMIPEHRVL